MRVIIESPYSASLYSVEKHIFYSRRCLLDSLNRQESPVAFHLLYTQVLNDKIELQRKKAMELALRWYDAANLCAVYTDLGISAGMLTGMDYAKKINLKIEHRSLKNDNSNCEGLTESPGFSKR